MSDKKLSPEELQQRLFIIENVVRNLIGILVDEQVQSETPPEENETFKNLVGLGEAWRETLIEVAKDRSKIIRLDK